MGVNEDGSPGRSPISVPSSRGVTDSLPNGWLISFTRIQSHVACVPRSRLERLQATAFWAVPLLTSRHFIACIWMLATFHCSGTECSARVTRRSLPCHVSPPVTPLAPNRAARRANRGIASTDGGCRPALLTLATLRSHREVVKDATKGSCTQVAAHAKPPLRRLLRRCLLRVTRRPSDETIRHLGIHSTDAPRNARNNGPSDGCLTRRRLLHQERWEEALCGTRAMNAVGRVNAC
jgi:hypothetical protein